jgi:ionotropic glutamate receptor
LARRIYRGGHRGCEIPINRKKLQVGIVTSGGKYIDANEDSLTGVVKTSGLQLKYLER